MACEEGGEKSNRGGGRYVRYCVRVILSFQDFEDFLTIPTHENVITLHKTLKLFRNCCKHAEP